MKVLVKDATNIQLNWLVAKCEYPKLVWGETIGIHWASHQIVIPSFKEPECYWNPTTDPAQAWPIIDRESISIIRCDDDYTTDRQGFTTSKRIPVWAAEHGGGHSPQSSYEGEHYPDQYEIPESSCSYGVTSLVAAMRCFITHELGNEVEVPDDL